MAEHDGPARMPAPHPVSNAREVLARSSIECEAVDPSAYDVLEGAERSAALQRAFDRVKARERALMTVLLADPEPTYAEISAALGMPIGGVGPTRMRAIARLREDRELRGRRPWD